ncbi:hypothetical protein THIOSC15_140003 [uncultured Thiomicrorhabdus sp.]
MGAKLIQKTIVVTVAVAGTRVKFTDSDAAPEFSGSPFVIQLKFTRQ